MLEGIRILDFTMLLPGPYATLRLAELGAEVIKVEPPQGDPARNINDGWVFLANNRNKGSAVLDLKTDSGHAEALELARSSDVVIEGFRPGVVTRLGIDYPQIQSINPGVIYCSLTGYGQSGPRRNLAGHDLNYLAVSGVLDQLSGGDGVPVVPAIQFGDLIGGITVSEVILAALWERGQTGQGKFLDIAMTDALTGLLTNHALIQAKTGYRHGVEVLNGSALCYHLYATKEGRYMALAALEPKFWQAFCRAVERPEWISKQFSPTQPENPTFLEIVRLFQSRDLLYWTRMGEQADCCLTPVLHIDEVSEARNAERIFDMETAHWGVLRQVAIHAGSHGMKPVMWYEPPPLHDR